MIDTRRFPIVDAHQHFWDLNLGKHPWLCREPWIHSRYGDYSGIRTSYMPADYLDDARDFQISKTVYVETEWDPHDPGGEVNWVKAVMAQHGYPHAVVAQAWLDRDDVEDVLAAHAESGIVRSVRHKPTVTHSRHTPAPRGAMSDERWRAGYGLLARYGLSFDLQVAYWHLPEAARLAADFPQIPLIINHTGLPQDRSEAGLEVWKTALASVAAQPNVALKISGIGTPGTAWSVQHNREVVNDAIDLFGARRCMFASNFPVDRLCADYRTIMAGFMEIVADRPEHEQRSLFHDNAVRYYGL